MLHYIFMRVSYYARYNYVIIHTVERISVSDGNHPEDDNLQVYYTSDGRLILADKFARCGETFE